MYLQDNIVVESGISTTYGNNSFKIKIHSRKPCSARRGCSVLSVVSSLKKILPTDFFSSSSHYVYLSYGCEFPERTGREIRIVATLCSFVVINAELQI